MCHLMNTSIYDYAPQIPAKIRERGDEFVGHGVTNSEEQGGYPKDGETDLIARATEAFRTNEGDGPGGWMGPWISESAHTPDLLHAHGYRYIMDWSADDQPFWMTTETGFRSSRSRITSKSTIHRLSSAVGTRPMISPAW